MFEFYSNGVVTVFIMGSAFIVIVRKPLRAYFRLTFRQVLSITIKALPTTFVLFYVKTLCEIFFTNIFM